MRGAATTRLRANATPRYRLLAPGRQLYHPGAHQPLQAADEARCGEFLRGEGLNQNGPDAEKVAAQYIGEHLIADQRGALRLRAHQRHRPPKPPGNGFHRRGDNRHVQRAADGLRADEKLFETMHIRTPMSRTRPTHCRTGSVGPGAFHATTVLSRSRMSPRMPSATSPLGSSARTDSAYREGINHLSIRGPTGSGGWRPGVPDTCG